MVIQEKQSLTQDTLAEALAYVLNVVWSIK